MRGTPVAIIGLTAAHFLPSAGSVLTWCGASDHPLSWIGLNSNFSGNGITRLPCQWWSHTAAAYQSRNYLLVSSPALETCSYQTCEGTFFRHGNASLVLANTRQTQKWLQAKQIKANLQNNLCVDNELKHAMQPGRKGAYLSAGQPDKHEKGVAAHKAARLMQGRPYGAHLSPVKPGTHALLQLGVKSSQSETAARAVGPKDRRNRKQMQRLFARGLQAEGCNKLCMPPETRPDVHAQRSDL